MVVHTCKTCGRNFEKGIGNYCSYNCYIKSRTDIKERRCLFCGKLFRANPSNAKKGYAKFCSPECYRKSDIYANRKTREKKYSFFCIFCGEKFERSGHTRRNNKYCSEGCAKRDMIGNNHPRWCGGPKNYCEKWTHAFRNRIRGWNAHHHNGVVTCDVCNTTQNGRLFTCHHVYYEKKACCIPDTNGVYHSNLGIKDAPYDFEVIGDPNKFIVLCDTCHGKTSSKKNRHYWARQCEQLINTKYQGRSYFTVEEWELLNSTNPQYHSPAIPAVLQAPIF